VSSTTAFTSFTETQARIQSIAHLPHNGDFVERIGAHVHACRMPVGLGKLTTPQDAIWHNGLLRRVSVDIFRPWAYTGRDMRKKRRVVATFAAVFVATLGMAGSFQYPPRPPDCAAQPSSTLPAQCRVADRTPPRREAGPVADNNYCFEHVSDVDRQEENGTTTNQYRHWLVNWHGTNRLDAEWKKANIAFDNIAPLSCAVRGVDTQASEVLDNDAPVLYGRRKEHNEPAKLFAEQQVTQRSYPDLRGFVYAGLRLDDEARFVVDLRSRAYLVGRELRLEISTPATNGLLYSLPDLGRLIGGQAVLERALVASTWTRAASGGDWFQIASGETAKLFVQDVAIVRRVDLKVNLARPSRPEVVLGSSSIPAYVPQ